MERESETVTYGVKGLIEWRVDFPMGESTLRVHFTGGAMTKYGVQPATYSTSNKAVQRVIENSRLYHSGRIKILKREWL